VNLSQSQANNLLKENVREFRSGKRDFSVSELNDIKLYLLKYKDLLNDIVFYEGTLKDYKVISCFSDSYYEELFDHIFTKREAAIGIIVVLTEKKILLQRNDRICKIDLCALAKLLCDGDCLDLSANIAEGKITDKFLKFSKTLQACTTPKI
jgi:hypothetical protein